MINFNIISSIIPQFSDEQLLELKELGLNDQQIRRLDAALIFISGVFAKSPQLGDVNAILKDLDENIERLQLAISALQAANADAEDDDGTPLHMREPSPHAEAYEWLEDAQIKTGSVNVIWHAVQVLADLREVTQCAISGLPRDPKTGGLLQRRSHYANIKPVVLIYRALADGWRDAHPPSENGQSPALNIEISGAENGAFSQIVGICYEAVTGRRNNQRDNHRERVIDKFIRRYRLRQQAHPAGEEKRTPGVTRI